MDSMIILAVFLYFICAVLLITEVFVPSGGLISILALACLIGDNSGTCHDSCGTCGCV